MSDPGLNHFTDTASVDDERPFAVDTQDVLSDPDEQMLGWQFGLHWPPGLAWGTPDGQALDDDSVLAKLARSLAAPWRFLYARAWKLTQEARPFATDELLSEWEAELGLPDKCTGFNPARAARLQAVSDRYRGVPIITPADFVRVAEELGYTIVIEEAFAFECGWSECGGHHAAGPMEQDAYWTVYVLDQAVEYFRTSESEVSVDPLFALPGINPLVCKFRELAPGWSLPIFLFEEPPAHLYP